MISSRRHRGAFGGAELKTFPNAEAFRRIFKPGHAIPLSIEVDVDLETPVSIFLKIADRRNGAFLFESVEGGENSTRWSFVGTNPRSVLQWSLTQAGDPFEDIRKYLNQYKSVHIDEMPPFTGGLVGYFSYDAIQLIEPRVPITGADQMQFPDALFMDFDLIIAFDHLHHSAHFIVECRGDEGDDPDLIYAKATERLHQALHTLENPLPKKENSSQVSKVPVELRPVRKPGEHQIAVQRAKEYIEAGDCQQIVLSQRFDAEIDIDPFDIYRALRRINPSPYLFFVQHQDHVLVGSSPESLVTLRDGEITSKPIAGTRPRGKNAQEDKQLKAELLADPKENAEHIMLVDLARNDVGRVAEIGSVYVDVLRKVERYSHVLHLVSHVKGKLAPGYDAVDLLRATFPHGTVSGTPKVRAMEIIDELEMTRRGPYAGCLGYFSRNGNMDMAITIRTLLHSKGKISVQAGGGIVYDSEPVAEERETVAKASALFAAVTRAQSRDNSI